MIGGHDRIVLAHGGGGELMGRLIRERFLPVLENPQLVRMADAAVLPWSSIPGVPAKQADLVFTTDSYVVTPIEFPGGDIGRLAVCGTVNDLAVMGAEPVALSLGLILEEGLPLAVLDRIVATIAAAAREAGVQIVTGDTKVIERRSVPGSAAPAASSAPLPPEAIGPEHWPEAAHLGAAAAERNPAAKDEPADAGPWHSEGMFINTAGIGRLRAGVQLGIERIEPGDVILINGNIADHGLAVMSVRAGLRFESTLRSDAAPLNGLIAAALGTRADVKFMRDPTRGGLAGVLADISEGRDVTVEIEESRIPISATARHAAEMLGLDPLTVANEGKCVIVVAADGAERVLAAWRAHPLGKESAIIGRTTDARPALVELITRTGGRRVVQRPYGEELPRIC